MSTANDTELKLLERTARSFAEKELIAGRRQNDKYPFAPFWNDVLEKSFKAGFFHAILSEELGGMGRKLSPLCILLREISKADASLAAIIFTNALAQEIIYAAGAQQILGEMIEKASCAKSTILAYPAFCNPGEIELDLEANGEKGSYRLNGKLDYVTCAGLASGIIVPARIAGQSGYSFFCVDSADQGLKKSEPVFSLGLRACPSVDIDFDNVKAEMIGESEKGEEYFKIARDRISAAASAISTGILFGTFHEALEYSRERSQGGREIINWSIVRMMLSDMAINLKVAQMSLQQAQEAVDAQLPDWRQCSWAAAIHTHELTVASTTEGIQILGGAGYMTDFGQEKRFRDAQQAQALCGMAPTKKLEYIRSMIE